MMYYFQRGPPADNSGGSCRFRGLRPCGQCAIIKPNKPFKAIGNKWNLEVFQ